jgi:hypothetical protein
MEKPGIRLNPSIRLFILPLFFIALGLLSCQRYKACDPATDQGCPSGTVCEALGSEKGLCLKICNPDIDNHCGNAEVCFRYADNNYACTPTCNPNNASSCPEGWLCAAVAGGENVCRLECDVNSAACPDGEVCQPLSEGISVCTTQCDPLDAESCGDNWACELRSDGLYMCSEPVFIKGTVFDSSTKYPIEKAHVIAIDKTGAAATDVAITDINGAYEIQVPVERNPDGTLHEGTFTLRVAAANYLPYPYDIRPAIPVDATKASHLKERGWLLQNAATNVALIALPAEKQGMGSISGKVIVAGENKLPGGVLIVAETGTEAGLIGFSDKKGTYTIFNVPAGRWEAHGYKAFLQLDSIDVSLAMGEDKTGIDLKENARPYGTVSGNINIVNAPGGSATSVVLVPESTFNQTFVKGEVPPGLRAPSPPEPPSISGSFSIPGVPDGKYVVLAAFENDFLVRDPDPNIAGTQIVHITVPNGSSYEISMSASFKVTEALVIVYPGEKEPELITENPTFIWEDDSSETKYSVVVYSAFGNEVWRNDNLPRVTGTANVTVNYAGEPLQEGMYYQFRATSWRDTGPVSQTEDMLGVFYKTSSQ